MQKLSTAAAVTAAKNLSKKRQNFVNLHFYTYKIKKSKKKFLES
jgi:hypothetical protein